MSWITISSTLLSTASAVSLSSAVRLGLHMACSGRKHALDDYPSAPPGINRIESEGNFSKDEKELIIRMYNLVGERWSIIAGRIPGRSAEEVKKYCMSHYSSSTGEVGE